jgi:hypothetical protein
MLSEFLMWICISLMAFIVMAMPAIDLSEETDFPKQTKPTVTVFVKQFDGMNHMVFKGCVLLSETVEC